MMSTARSALQTGQQPATTGIRRLARILQRLPAAYQIYRERRALLSLSDHALKDLGLSRADAYREATRPWWEIPRDR